MKNKFNELQKAIISLGRISEKELENISNDIDKIIEYKIEDERTISHIFDAILSMVFVEDDKKREVFHKLSNYCRGFDKELADDYDKILEEDLTDNYDEDIDNKIEYEKIVWYEEGMKQLTSKDRNYLEQKRELKKFFVSVKNQTKQIPKLNSLKTDEISNNKLYSDLCYLAIKFFKEVMTEEDFKDLKYESDRIKKYGETVIKDMFEYYTDKFKI